MAEKSAPPDLRVAAIARQHHGVVSIAQLHDAGLTDSAVLGRTRAGRLHRIHRGVYAVGHRGLSLEGRWLAAVLACGDGAVLSHRSAAGLWRLLNPIAAPVHVSLPGRGGRRQRPGIRIHRPRALSPSHVTVENRIPVTSAARTIADLKPHVSPMELRRAIRQAEVLGLPTGAPTTQPTRSELEDRFLRLCKQHAIPTPRVNLRVAGLEVDFLWPEQQLIVETDGYRFHRGQIAFEADHGRDLRLRAAGYITIRLTYRQISTEPTQIAKLIARELAV